MRRLIIPMVLVAAMFGQMPPAKAQASRTVPKQSSAAKSGIDTVIELVQGGTPEALVIKSIQHQGTAYDLLPADVLKLKKAGVTENIINVMMDPKASVVEAAPASPVVTEPVAKNSGPASADPASASPLPAVTVVVTPFPPDIDRTLVPVRKPRLVIDSFSPGDTQQQAAYWFNNNRVDIGAGISALLSVRLNKSSDMTVLERSKLKAIEIEQDRSLSNRTDPGKRTPKGKLVGTDYMIVGEVVQFGWDSKAKNTSIPTIWFPTVRIPSSNLNVLRKEDKAVVAITFRVVDAQTGEQITNTGGDAKGESSRKTKGYSGTLAIPGAGWINGGGDMTSSAFCKTIIGEATSNAVDNIVQQLESQVSKLPPRKRNIEGRVASVTGSGVYLAIGANDGVMVGDRYEIRQINNEVLDPDTKDPIAVEAVKVGELVVTDVTNDKASFGNYGGQPLSSTYAKGYQARLMSK